MGRKLWAAIVAALGVAVGTVTVSGSGHKIMADEPVSMRLPTGPYMEYDFLSELDGAWECIGKSLTIQFEGGEILSRNDPSELEAGTVKSGSYEEEVPEHRLMGDHYLKIVMKDGKIFRAKAEIKNGELSLTKPDGTQISFKRSTVHLAPSTIDQLTNPKQHFWGDDAVSQVLTYFFSRPFLWIPVVLALFLTYFAVTRLRSKQGLVKKVNKDNYDKIKAAPGTSSGSDAEAT